MGSEGYAYGKLLERKEKLKESQDSRLVKILHQGMATRSSGRERVLKNGKIEVLREKE